MIDEVQCIFCSFYLKVIYDLLIISSCIALLQHALQFIDEAFFKYLEAAFQTA